jgi:polysaccharide export outer membrane protein
LDALVLEAVIAHELAHLRRWDLAINWAQRVVEAVLFFHPVVWWCSRRIRAEREMCCDELALGVVDNRLEYAKALADLARRDVSRGEPAWAAGIGGSKMVLLERIRNVLGLAAEPQGRLHGPKCALSGAAAASLVWIVVLAVAWGPAPSASPYAGTVQAQAKNMFPAERFAGELNRFPLGQYTNAGLTGAVAVDFPPAERLRAEHGDQLHVTIKMDAHAEPAVISRWVDGDGDITLGERQVHVDGMTEGEVANTVRATMAKVPAFRQVIAADGSKPAVGVLDEDLAPAAAEKAEISVVLAKKKLVSRPAPSSAPAEGSMRTLPIYTIEPPDVLLIDVKQLVPKPPHKIRAGDKLSVLVTDLGATDGDEIFVKVSPQGTIEFTDYPLHLTVVGLSEEQAAKSIHDMFKEGIEEEFKVTVQIDSFAGIQPIEGEHLVGPDGTVNLGSYGQVQVAGLTLEKAKAAINERLSRFLIDPDAAVSVFAYNSKVYYIIRQNVFDGDTVMRLPVTGNETVLDALGQVNGLKNLDKKAIFIARPLAGAGKDQILQVNWESITTRAATATNYQVLPGDRIFVVEPPLKPVYSY